MAGIAMRDLLKIDIFQHQLETLKETSLDSANQIRMTESELEVIDFDGVKNEYIADLKLVDTPKSNDALYIHESGALYFIEFKNGNMEKEIHGVRRKIFDSLLIFTDIIGQGISFTREKMKYILVYNEEKSPDGRGNRLKKDEVQESVQYNRITSFISRSAGRTFDRFGLRNQFKGFCFKEVYTYTAEEFVEKVCLK